MSIMNLFNGGGSVRSKPSSSPGPKTRQKLQPRTPDVLGNVSDRYYREGNVEGMGRIGQEMRNRLKNNPGLQPGTGYLFPNIQEPWNNPGPGSYWNASAPQPPGDNSGVMAAVANNPALIQQAKNFYNLFDPWMPNLDVGENTLGYEFEKPILGGTLGYGFDYNWDDENVGAFFNWKKELGA